MRENAKCGVLELDDHCRIAWRMDGPEDAPVVVLSNSLGTTMSLWDSQIDALATPFRMLRYDQRGHGASDVPPGAYSLDRLGRDVLELTSALGIDHFAFCGISLGGMIGQWLGWRAPERVTAIIIANSSAHMGPPSAWDSRIDMVLSEGMASMKNAVNERWFTPEFRANPANVSVMLHELEATPPQGYAGCCAAIRDMDMRQALPLIDVPTLIIGGLRDPATPPEHSVLLEQGIAGSKREMLDTAHLSNLELPEIFNALVLAFLQNNGH